MRCPKEFRESERLILSRAKLWSAGLALYPVRARSSISVEDGFEVAPSHDEILRHGLGRKPPLISMSLYLIRSI